MDHGLVQMKLFDGRDNRKTIIDCFRRMGRNLPDDMAGARRAGFLSGIAFAINGAFKGRPIVIEGSPTTEEAYDLLLQICAHVGVPIQTAAELLEKAVKTLEGADYAAPLEKEWWQ